MQNHRLQQFGALQKPRNRRKRRVCPGGSRNVMQPAGWSRKATTNCCERRICVRRWRQTAVGACFCPRRGRGRRRRRWRCPLLSLCMLRAPERGSYNPRVGQRCGVSAGFIEQPQGSVNQHPFTNSKVNSTMGHRCRRGASLPADASCARPGAVVRPAPYLSCSFLAWLSLSLGMVRLTIHQITTTTMAMITMTSTTLESHSTWLLTVSHASPA